MPQRIPIEVLLEILNRQVGQKNVELVVETRLIDNNQYGLKLKEVVVNQELFEELGLEVVVKEKGDEVAKQPTIREVLAQMQTSMTRQFDQIDQRFAQQADQINQRIDQQFNQINQRIDQRFAQQAAHSNQRLDRIDQRLANIEQDVAQIKALPTIAKELKDTQTRER